MAVPEYIFADMDLRHQGQGMWETVPFHIHPDSPKYVRDDLCITRATHDRLIAEAVAAAWEDAKRIVSEYPDHREIAGFDWRAEIQSAMDRAAAIRGQS